MHDAPQGGVGGRVAGGAGAGRHTGSVRGQMTEAIEGSLATASSRAPERFRAMLWAKAGDESCGVVRTKVLRSTPLLDSYHHSDRTISADLVLYGPFYQVPDWLYLRRTERGIRRPEYEVVVV